MQEILVEHFTKKESSRAIVFCEYCEGAREAYAILLQQSPLIKPKCFMGQNSITQREQLSVITYKYLFVANFKCYLKYVFVDCKSI